MPRKNTRLRSRAAAFIHAYNRERSGAPMFRDNADRRHFKALMERALSPTPSRNSKGRTYANYSGRVKLVALALMTNHFHAVVIESEQNASGELFRSVMSSYVRYFNARHGRSGAMFDGEVRRRPATGRRDELNAVAYVHENHGDHCYCEFCTHALYLGHSAHVPEWIDVAEGLRHFGGVDGYLRWLDTRRSQRAVLEAVGSAPEPRRARPHL